MEKGGTVVGGLFAGTFAVLLVLFPAIPERYFAWAVRPPVAAAWFGAAYIFRTYFFWENWRATDWRRIRVFQWGNFVFSTVLILATLIHRDRFIWSSISAWIWLILYLAEPLWVLYLIRSHPPEPHTPAGRPVARPFRWILAVEAIVFMAVGAVLFLAPQAAGTAWAWPLTPLNARAMAAWPLGWAVWAGSMALSREWDRIRLATRTQIVFGLGLILHVVLYLPQLAGGPVTWLYIASTVLLPAVATYFYWRHERAAT